MNERIENTYTRSGRIANPTEQEVNATLQSLIAEGNELNKKINSIIKQIGD